MSVIKEYRNKLGISQTEFAGRVGVSLATVKRWEKKSIAPTLKQAYYIYNVLRVPFGKLLNDYK